MKSTFHSQALEGFQSLTVFIAFVTVWFSIKYETLSESTSEISIPSVQQDARNNERSRRRLVLLSQGVPFLFLTLFPIFPLSPLAVRILENAHLKFWKLDMITGSYCLLDTYLLLAFIWVLILNFKIANRAFGRD